MLRTWTSIRRRRAITVLQRSSLSTSSSCSLPRDSARFAVLWQRSDGDLFGDDERQWPALAPAFSADDLSAEPTNVWLTNGGSLANQRYSPLDAIDTGNVEDLKGVWMTDLESATAAKYSAEAQPIVYDGVIYVPTGDDDVFAVDLEIGRDPLEVRVGHRPAHRHRLLRLAQPRCRARRREGLHRAARREARRPRSANGPEGVGDRGRQAHRGLHDHCRAALLRRDGDHGCVGRRVLDPRARAGLRRRDGRARLAVPHGPWPG